MSKKIAPPLREAEFKIKEEEEIEALKFCKEDSIRNPVLEANDYLD